MQKKRNTAQRMYSLMEQYETGEWKQREFCARHRIKKSTFGYWLRKYRAENQEENPGFVPIQVRDAGPHSLEVTYPSGIRLQFDHRVPAAYVRELLNPLE